MKEILAMKIKINFQLYRYKLSVIGRHYKRYFANAQIHTYKITFRLGLGHSFLPSLMLWMIILYISARICSLRSSSNDRFFEIIFHCNFISLTELLPQVCWEEVTLEIFFRIFFLLHMSDLGFEPIPHV